jgi:hypothetical protein
MQANRGRSYYIKSLIALRNYSFRNLPQEIKQEAFRESNVVIHKDTVPPLSEVIDLRLDYLLQKPEIVDRYSNTDALNEAYKTLKTILQSLYGQYNEMLLALTHNNIFDSMDLLLRIVTNKQFIGKNEIERKGAYEVTLEQYQQGRGPRSSSLRNDDVFFSLVYGENNIYQDDADYFFTNILHYKERDNYNTELCGLLIIQYLLQHNIYYSDLGYNFDTAEDNRNVISQINSLFEFPVEKLSHDLKSGLNFMMKYMYEGGAVRQSIKEPKYNDGRSFSRTFHTDMKIYLSRRGLELYKMLEKNALLLLVYRDDIDTDLDNNDKSTITLSMAKSIQYCIKYIDHLFEIEINLSKNIKNKEKYIYNMGNKLPTVVLMNGIRESILRYFSDKKQNWEETVLIYNKLAEKMRDYISDFSEDGRYAFESVTFISL